MIDAESSLIDVAFEACSALDRAGIVAVLCGGSAASYYCAEYQSLGADFVLRLDTSERAVNAALVEIGYRRGVSNVYSNHASRFTIEFPAGPLAIGRKIVQTWLTVNRRELLLHVISAEDSVCDRFLHYWAWHDRSARAIALEVARVVPNLDAGAIAAWAAGEMAADSSYDPAAWVAFEADLLEPMR